MRLFNDIRAPWSQGRSESRLAPVYTYEVMYRMPIDGIFDAMVVENVIKHFIERTKCPLHLIEPDGIRLMADEARDLYYQPRVMDT